MTLNVSGDESIVNKFIQNGGNVNEANKFQVTPLLVAIQEVQPKITEILIKNGADVNHRDLRGRIPLELNAQYGKI